MARQTEGNALKLFVTTFRDGMLMRPKNVYTLWAELFPSMLVDERTGQPIPERNLKAQASKYARKRREDLCDRLPMAPDAEGRVPDGASVLVRVGMVFPRRTSGSEGLMALELEAQFLDAWRFCGCDSSRLFEALETHCGLGVLFEDAFVQRFARYLRTDFPGASEADVAEYQGEILGLPRMLSAGVPFGMESCKKVLFDAVVLLVTGALAGPRSYMGELGYTLPSFAKTPALKRPTRTVAPVETSAQLVAVVARDELGRTTYTQATVPVRVRRDEVLLVGRDKRWAQERKGCVGVVSPFELVSRHHATVCWCNRESRWELRDVGVDGDGSTYGTLVIHALGGREYVRGASVALRHGDLVCLAPRDRGDEGYEPVVGQENAVYRFEVVR